MPRNTRVFYGARNNVPDAAAAAAALAILEHAQDLKEVCIQMFVCMYVCMCVCMCVNEGGRGVCACACACISWWGWGRL